MKFFIVSVEASGDQIGNSVISSLSAIYPDAEFRGVGGDCMRSNPNFTCTVPVEDFGVCGIIDVVMSLPKIAWNFFRLYRHIASYRPDVLITIDGYSFNIRLARLVKRLFPEVRRIHCVAPAVWAYMKWRAKICAKVFDHMLTLFPYELAYFRRWGLSCDCIGHPSIDVPIPANEKILSVKKEFFGNTAEDVPLILVLFGSRKGGVHRVNKLFKEILSKVKTVYPSAKIITVVSPGVAVLVQDMLKEWPFDVQIVNLSNDSYIRMSAQKFSVFAAADVALSHISTVNMELARTNTPVVSVLAVDKIVRVLDFLTRPFGLSFYAIPTNFVLNKEVVPEWRHSLKRDPNKMARLLINILDHSHPDYLKQLEGYAQSYELLFQISAEEYEQHDSPFKYLIAQSVSRFLEMETAAGSGVAK
jgi:lipid-A-disaccharide synthase